MPSPHVIPVLGLHGVGKSTLCERIAAETGAEHINFGDFLRSYLTELHGHEIGTNEMRALLADEETSIECSRAFVQRLQRATAEHVLIDTGGYLADLGAGDYHSNFYVWDLLVPSLVIVVLGRPAEIQSRRRTDEKKTRPTSGESVERIERQQHILLCSATAAAAKHGASVAFVQNDEINAAVAATQRAIQRSETERSAVERLLEVVKRDNRSD